MSVISVAGIIWVIFNITTKTETYFGCLFRKITTIPCPSCGSTRSVMCILEGKPGEAVIANPFGYIITGAMIILPLWLLIDLILWKDTLHRQYKNMERQAKRKAVYIPVIIIFIANWIWNIIKYK
jgi:hypothetical protein